MRGSGAQSQCWTPNQTKELSECCPAWTGKQQFRKTTILFYYHQSTNIIFLIGIGLTHLSLNINTARQRIHRYDYEIQHMRTVHTALLQLQYNLYSLTRPSGRAYHAHTELSGDSTAPRQRGAGSRSDARRRIILITKVTARADRGAHLTVARAGRPHARGSAARVLVTGQTYARGVVAREPPPTRGDPATCTNGPLAPIRSRYTASRPRVRCSEPTAHCIS